MNSPLEISPLFSIGPIGVTAPVVTTWGLMALIGGGAAGLTRRLAFAPSRKAG